MRLINADELKKKAFGKRGGLIHTRDIDDAPTVDAVPRKQGYWVRWYEEIHDSFGVVFEPHCKCSECEMEYDPYYANTVNYCSHCGARIEVKNAIN